MTNNNNFIPCNYCKGKGSYVADTFDGGPSMHENCEYCAGTGNLLVYKLIKEKTFYHNTYDAIYDIIGLISNGFKCSNTNKEATKADELRHLFDDIIIDIQADNEVDGFCYHMSTHEGENLVYAIKSLIAFLEHINTKGFYSLLCHLHSKFLREIEQEAIKEIENGRNT